jgi:ATP-dependent helicase/DNAse subunit B
MAPTVNILLGPARCGKTHRLTSQYRQVLQAAQPKSGQPNVGRAVWLAPTVRTAMAVREALLRGGLSACLDPGVTTFQALAGRVLSGLAAPPRALSRLGTHVLLRQVTDAALDNGRLKFLAQAGRRGSFVELLDEHFQELKRRGVAPAAFARAIRPHEDRRQHDELAWLYAHYENLLQAHRLVDEEGRYWTARDVLADDASLFTDLEIVVADGFTDFTHTQLEILAELAGRAGTLLLSLPGELDTSGGRAELFAKSNATIAELRVLFPKLTVERMPCRQTAWPALDHITEHLFQHPRDVPPPSAAAIASLDRLEIVAAAGAQDEIIELARNIKRRLVDERNRTGHARPGDVVVVFRNLREAAPRVRDVFREFGIPHAIEAGVPLAATGIMRTLLDVLRLDTEDWPFRRLVSVVTNNLLTFADRGARTSAEWLIRDLQIAAGRVKLLERATLLQGELASASGSPATHRDQRSRAATAALPLLTELAAALDELPLAATPSDWIAALAQLSSRLGIPGQSPSSTHDENHSAWQEITKHFAAREQLADWLGEPAPQLSRAAVLDLLVDLARNESLPRPSDDTGRVRVLSAQTARTVDARHVFLAGMSEQAFPSPERAGKLYSETDYRFFANAADQSRAAAALPTLQRAQEEMLLFYEVLTRPSERLTISYPALDEKAQSLTPSPYVTEVERAILPAKVNHLRATRPAPLPAETSPLGPRDWRVRAMHDAIRPGGNLALLAGLFADDSSKLVAASLESALRIAAARGRRDAFGCGDGLLESDAARARLARRFGSEHLWSPSQWERFALCPYQFFLADVLGRQPLGELVLETDHRRRGTLVHRVLAEFHRSLPELLGSQGNLSAHDAEKFAAEFGNILDALVRATSHSGVEAALVELDRRQIAKWGPRYHEEHGKYDAAWPQLDAPLAPTYLEWRFGPARSEESTAENHYEDPRSTSQPFVLDLGDEQIRITGRIDRIDVGEAAGQSVFNIIDYKSGRRPSLTK